MMVELLETVFAVGCVIGTLVFGVLTIRETKQKARRDHAFLVRMLESEQKFGDTLHRLDTSLREWDRSCDMRWPGVR